MRKQILAGNWKMNTDKQEAQEITQSLLEQAEHLDKNVDMIIAPPFTNLDATHQLVKNKSIALAAQNVYYEDKGAFTGEVSIPMLKSFDVKYVIIGHSERRAVFNEDDDLLALKVKKCIEESLTPIFCVGEELEDRKENEHFAVVKRQLAKGLSLLDDKMYDHLIIAYEPVWAIGTGETASPEQAQEMHDYIRKELIDLSSEVQANNCTILYGGSVKPRNAEELFGQNDIDGGLIGGASLKPDDFIAIAKSF
ncbi:MAG: triose-phosphate isomerase [Psychroflexus sp.]|nr:triose-phosphate isomerase [Psychroflexus sp.]